MTRDDMIRMAREAGFEDHSNPELWDCMVVSHEAIERFAYLVAAHERAACAKAIDLIALKYQQQHYASDENVADECAAAIRARGQE